jgi:hypothetical protein
MPEVLSALFRWLAAWFRPRRPGSASDPYARVRVPLTPRPPSRSGSVALLEPDED